MPDEQYHFYRNSAEKEAKIAAVEKIMNEFDSHRDITHSLNEILRAGLRHEYLSAHRLMREHLYSAEHLRSRERLGVMDEQCDE